jgi:hypothetical protein
MNGCDRTQERLEGWVLGLLTGEERASVETHVASCAACAQAADEVRQLIGTLSRLPRQDEDAARMEQVVLREMDRGIRRRRRAWVALGYVAAAAAGLLVAYVLRPATGPSREDEGAQARMEAMQAEVASERDHRRRAEQEKDTLSAADRQMRERTLALEKSVAAGLRERHSLLSRIGDVESQMRTTEQESVAARQTVEMLRAELAQRPASDPSVREALEARDKQLAELRTERDTLQASVDRYRKRFDAVFVALPEPEPPRATVRAMPLADLVYKLVPGR